jgi:twinkle protein
MTARIIPLTGLRGSIEALWDRGLPRGDSTGWKTLDPYYTVAPGQMTIVTGWPGSGKSEWLDALLVNLASQGWTHAVFSFENQPTELHAAKLLEKLSGQPFGAGPTDRIPRDKLPELLTRLSQSFGLFRASSGGQDVSTILDSAAQWFEAYGGSKMGLVIDPWNELEHRRPNNLSETEYVSQSLSAIRQWARDSNVHVWIVAHPQKIRREDGKLPIPRPDMISGSQHWWNKADACITVWRDLEQQTQDVDVYIQKVRFKHIGRPGLVTFSYDRVTGRYHDKWDGLSRVV